MKENRILIGMSGGVDSSVAACLLRQHYACTGATMQLYGDASESIRDAKAVAEKLDIPYLTMDLRPEFEALVIRNFIAAYESGLTPNPCIRCNQALKFGILLEKALEMGFSKVATGHYARILQDEETGRYLLYKAADPKKDQSYFLAGLNQHQLSHTLFPLGSLTKEEARQIAEENALLNARKRDSQDICFVPDGDYVAFMEHHTGKRYRSGSYLDLNGKVIGTHQGAVCYTIGQRKGLGIALGAPAYVCGKNMENNTVTLGPNEALFSSTLRAVDWNWIPFPALEAPLPVTARIRHSQFEQSAVVYPEGGNTALVEFLQPQRAISPGQAVVLYSGDMVIGSGTISQVL